MQLVDRKTRPLQLTAAGLVFLVEARQVSTQLEQAIVSAQRASRGKIERLTLGVNILIANSVLPDILRTFRDRYPGVALVLHELVSYQQLQELRNRQVDLGFVHLHNAQKINENDDTLSFVSILQEPLVIVLPENHPLAAQTQVSLEALADELFILPPPQFRYKTDRDVASGQVIRNRGIELISTVGQTGKETACADVSEAGRDSVLLAGTRETQSRQVSKPRKRVTRKTQK
ncbi:LysR substrate-binding domain-containing protein [Lyngbya aestuarii]|uniref:LysR substrate-binding domain-containing protein n=1 Tax=Lyngbya aestuarii TaxID=118322 RepID=UPI00403D5776